MTEDKNAPNPPDDTLCDHCVHQPECDEHHMMCVNFEANSQEERPDSLNS